MSSTRPKSPEYSMRGREMFGAVDESAKTSQTPGPGAYGRPLIPGPDAPKYSLAKRLDKPMRRSSTPGPGAVTCNDTNVCLVLLILTHTSLSRAGRYKGPSSFGPQVESTIRTNAGSAFNKSKRPPLLSAGGPIGPGERLSPTSTGTPALIHATICLPSLPPPRRVRSRKRCWHPSGVQAQVSARVLVWHGVAVPQECAAVALPESWPWKLQAAWRSGQAAQLAPAVHASTITRKSTQLW